MNDVLVERVAQAMAEDGGQRYESLAADAQRGFRRMARAAIAAMREPTVDMIERGYSYRERPPAETWRAMIDAALAVEETSAKFIWARGPRATILAFGRSDTHGHPGHEAQKNHGILRQGPRLIRVHAQRPASAAR